MSNSANSHFKKLIVTHISVQTPTFKVLQLQEKDGEKIPYKAGQFLTFVYNNGVEEIRRSYSIISSPQLNEPLAIGVKRIYNGALSRILTDSTKVGDELTTIGANGFFTLPAAVQGIHQLFFLAAGSGITPIISLIKTALAIHHHITITLVYSSHAQGEAIFYNELKALQQQFSNRFYIEFIFSSNPNLYKAHLHKELLKDYLKQFVPNRQTTLFYICGPEAYMRMCQYTLLEAQVPQHHIKKEIFAHHQATMHKTAPPDTAPHKVTLYIKKDKHLLTVQYPHTILDAAKKEGLPLPYSCETGKCGSCVAKCISGKIWMSYNEVLTDAEINDGLVLTCTGYPIAGDAVLHI